MYHQNPTLLCNTRKLRNAERAKYEIHNAVKDGYSFKGTQISREYSFVKLGADTSSVEEQGDEAVITYCQEQNELALEAIRQTLE